MSTSKHDAQTQPTPSPVRRWAIKPQWAMAPTPEVVPDIDGEIAAAVRRAADASPTAEVTIELVMS